MIVAVVTLFYSGVLLAKSFLLRVLSTLHSVPKLLTSVRASRSLEPVPPRDGTRRP
jgi:hypothetical protein